MRHVCYTRSDIPVSALIGFVLDSCTGAQVIFSYESSLELYSPVVELQAYEVTPAGEWVHQWCHTQDRRFYW